MLGRGLESLIPKKNNPITAPTGENDRPKELAAQSPAAENKIAPPLIETPQQTGQTFQSPSPIAPRKQMPERESVFQLEVEKIVPNPHQPRRDFNPEELKELAASIREHGIIQPLIVSKIEKETNTGTSVDYQLIAGERRLQAAKMAGLERVPAIIRKLSQKSEGLELAIIENLQRSNLNSIETARAYAKLQDEFGLTQREIAARLGKSRETIANGLRLLNLPSEIQEAVSQGHINESQARLLLAVSDMGEQQKLFKEIMSQNLSVREIRSRIGKSNPQQPSDAQRQKTADPEMMGMEEQLKELLGAPVKIVLQQIQDYAEQGRSIEKKDNSGKIIITFYSPEEIQGIIQKLNPKS